MKWPTGPTTITVFGRTNAAPNCMTIYMLAKSPLTSFPLSPALIANVFDRPYNNNPPALVVSVSDSVISPRVHHPLSQLSNSVSS